MEPAWKGSVPASGGREFGEKVLHNCQILSFLGFRCRDLSLSLIQLHLTIKPFCCFARAYLEYREVVCETTASGALRLTTERARPGLAHQRITTT